MTVFIKIMSVFLKIQTIFLELQGGKGKIARRKGKKCKEVEMKSTRDVAVLVAWSIV